MISHSNRWRWVALCSAVVGATLFMAGCGRQESRDAERKAQEPKFQSVLETPPALKKRADSGWDVNLTNKLLSETLAPEERKMEEQRKKREALTKQQQAQIETEAAMVSRLKDLPPSGILQETPRKQVDVIPVASLMLHSPQEASPTLGPPVEGTESTREGSKEVVYYYYASDDLEPVRLLFENGKRCISATITFKRPVSREKVLRRAGMASLASQPQKNDKGNLIWNSSLPWKNGCLILEAAEAPPGAFWGVIAEAATKTRGTPKTQIDETWGIGR